MKSFWILEVFLLLCAVELEATSVSEFCCPKRNLIVTVDDQLRLYFDGIEISNLPNANIHNKPDVVDFPCTTRLIAIHGRNGDAGGPAGIWASTGDDYVLTNSTWKCSNFSHIGWETLDFDDSAWTSALDYGRNVESSGAFVPEISPNAARMWLRESTGQELNVYCRKTLGYDCCCYATNGGKSCKVGIESTGDYKTVATIFGVLFGVSILANMALVLWNLHSQRKIGNFEGREHPKCEDESGIDNQIQQNGIASGDEIVNPAIFEYPE